MLKLSEKTGRPFCFQPDQLWVCGGHRMVILGNRQYCLAKAAVAEREEIYIPLEDLHRLLAPELTYELDDSWAWIHLKGAYPVQAKLRDIQGIPGVGIVRLLCKTYGMQACRNGEILVIRLDGTCPEPGAWKLRQMQWLLEERQVGNLFHTEWFPEAGRLNSYRLYVPCGWEHQIRKPMLVYLHGAGGNEDSGFERSWGIFPFLRKNTATWYLPPIPTCTAAIMVEGFRRPVCSLHLCMRMPRERSSTILRRSWRRMPWPSPAFAACWAR